MKVICFFICIFFAGASYSQKKSSTEKKVIINGVGIILLGKTEQDIVHDLQWDSLQIIDGTKETKDEFRKSITAAVVRVQYKSGSVLARDLQLQTEDACTGILEPERKLIDCSDVVEYFVPKYDFDSATLKHFVLTFYRDTLIDISATCVDSVENRDFVYSFEHRYGSYHTLVDHYFDGDNNDCNAIPYELDAFWESGTDEVLISWHTDSWCCDSKKEPQWVSYSEFSISNNRYRDEIIAKCANKK